MKEPYKVETFIIPKGTKYSWFEKQLDGKIVKKGAVYQQDMLSITGDCQICKQFPCKHTAFVMDSNWQKEQRKQVGK